MEEFKVFIPSAGLGSRVADINPKFNKAMLEIANKPVISHIIEKFDPSVPIVVAIGFQGDLLRQFLTLAYPDRNIEFVEVDPYEGPESGLGVTLKQSRHLLNCPFIFISNDTLVMDEIPTFSKFPDNWLGYAKVAPTQNHLYRTVLVEQDGQVKKLFEKDTNSSYPAYIGVCGIRWYEAFWNALLDDEAQNVGESYAIKKMLESNFKFQGIQFDWIDTGSVSGVDQAKSRVEGKDFTILEKPTESIWFVEDKVIKYSDDPEFIANRVIRMERLKKFVPQFLGATENMYAYKFVEGQTFSHINSIDNFKYLLEHLDKFWGAQVQRIDTFYPRFYMYKTYTRLTEYYSKFNAMDSNNEVINGKKYDSVWNYMHRIDLENYAAAIDVRFHGDLHFENILVNDFQDGSAAFTLLDWRQDFDGDLDYGDLYYDLAKLMHGLQISHELVAKNYFTIERRGNEVQFSYFRKSHYIEYEKILVEWIEERGFDLKKVRLLNALIFLNIAALHHYPYSHFLFYLGKTMLGDLLDDNLRNTV